jgi:hypothetical protein
MQLAQQVRDPLGHGFGNLGSCGQFAGDSCLDFFDDQVLARRLQGFSRTVSTSHAGTPRVDCLRQRKDWTFRSEVGFAVEAVRGSLRGNLEPELWLCRLKAMANDPSQELVPCHSKHPRTSKSTPRTV